MTVTDKIISLTTDDSSVYLLMQDRTLLDLHFADGHTGTHVMLDNLPPLTDDGSDESAAAFPYFALAPATGQLYVANVTNGDVGTYFTGMMAGNLGMAPLAAGNAELSCYSAISSANGSYLLELKGGTVTGVMPNELVSGTSSVGVQPILQPSGVPQYGVYATAGQDIEYGTSGNVAQVQVPAYSSTVVTLPSASLISWVQEGSLAYVKSIVDGGSKQTASSLASANPYQVAGGDGWLLYVDTSAGALLHGENVTGVVSQDPPPRPDGGSPGGVMEVGDARRPARLDGHRRRAPAHDLVALLASGAAP